MQNAEIAVPAKHAAAVDFDESLLHVASPTLKPQIAHNLPYQSHQLTTLQ